MKSGTPRRSGTLGAAMGLWAGASILGCLVAYVATFLLTGKLFIPHKQGDPLVSVEEATTFLDQIIQDAREAEHE